MSRPIFTANGKQILRDRAHFADGCSVEAAQMILAALILFHKPRSERRG